MSVSEVSAPAKGRDWGLIYRQIIGTMRLEIRRNLLARRSFAVYFLAFAPIVVVGLWAISPFPRQEFGKRADQHTDGRSSNVVCNGSQQVASGLITMLAA